MNTPTPNLPLVLTNESIHAAMAAIDRFYKGIVLVVSTKCELAGTITDGDIRRAILGGISLDAPVSLLLENKRETPYAKPVAAFINTPPDQLLYLMQQNSIRQIPLLDEGGRVVDLVMLEDLIPNERVGMQAVIMAGGVGSRLRPLTEDLPKPMLPVGDRPLMERVVEQLRDAGIQQIHITTHYKPERIISHFGDGSRFGVTLNYVTEEQPLGTAGALGLVPKPDSPLLIINGDILTRIDLHAFLAFHREQKALLTVAVRQYDMHVPYGVIDTEGARVKGIEEKPVLHFLVNAGIYLCEPEVLDFIPMGQPYNMTDLISHLIEVNRVVTCFPIVEYWLDIGQLADYEQAQQDVKGKFNQ